MEASEGGREVYYLLKCHSLFSTSLPLLTSPPPPPPLHTRTHTHTHTHTHTYTHTHTHTYIQAIAYAQQALDMCSHGNQLHATLQSLVDRLSADVEQQ